MLEFNPMNIDRLLKLANKKLNTENSAGAREIYDWNRTNLPNYFEVYLKNTIRRTARLIQKTSIINMTKELQRMLSALIY